MKSNQLKSNFDFEKNLPLWKRDTLGIAIERDFIFKDFQQAFKHGI